MRGPASASAPDIRDWVSANIDYDRRTAEPAKAMTPGITDIVREHLASQPYHWRFMKDKRKEMLASAVQKVRTTYQPPATLLAKYQPPGSYPVGASSADEPGGPVRFIFLAPFLVAIVSALVSKIFSLLWDHWFSNNNNAHAQLMLACGHSPPATDVAEAT